MDKKAGLRMILLRLATDFETGKREWATFRGESPEENIWVSRTLAGLRAEGSVEEIEAGAGGFKFTRAGYQRYLPQITAWRAEKESPVPEKGTEHVGSSGNLSLGLLFKIMKRMGELRADRSPFLESDRLFDLVEDSNNWDFPDLAIYVDDHLEFLQGRSYLELGRPTLSVQVRSVKLTTKGVMFVQPELADFGERSVLPEVAKSLEKQIDVLTYPPGEKEGLLFNLREAFVKNAPDLIVKALVEIGVRMAQRGGA